MESQLCPGGGAGFIFADHKRDSLLDPSAECPEIDELISVRQISGTA